MKNPKQFYDDWMKKVDLKPFLERAVKKLMVKSPFTDEQVKCLNEYQKAGHFHPFTCGGQKDGHDCRATLIATKDGWICPEGCGYTQDWAHGFMTQYRKETDPLAKKWNNL